MLLLLFFPALWCCAVLSHLSCVRLFVTPWTVAHQAPLSMGFSRQEYWSGFLQGIFLTQGSNPGLLHCRQILYHLSHQGNPFPVVFFIYYYVQAIDNIAWQKDYIRNVI